MGDNAFMRMAAEQRVTDQRREITRLKKLLRDLRPHVEALSVTDNDPEFKKLLQRIDDELKRS